MLQLKPNCEQCGKLLPNESKEAMICTFECTFCAECVETVLLNVCPNCGGGFEKRPTRPSHLLAKYPASKEHFVQALNQETFTGKLLKLKDVDPRKR